jgi:hypothetical protein
VVIWLLSTATWREYAGVAVVLVATSALYVLRRKAVRAVVG